MISQQLVKPEEIEAKLIQIWEELAKENKMRACLFNLIVFNRYSSRTDYIRSIVQKVVEKFPCRVLFISEDTQAKTPFLKTAISVLISGQEGNSACDQIDIGASGEEVQKVPYLLLAHLLPDLPITLLWTEDPAKEHPLFKPIAKLASRVIFDSESADSLQKFSKAVLDFHAKTKIDIADLNWARTEGWRDLVASLFVREERVDELKKLAQINLVYNAKPSDSFCHLNVQSLYLLAWLGSRLGLKLKHRKLPSFSFDTLEASIENTRWEKLGSASVISIKLQTKEHLLFHCERLPDRYHYVQIQISSPQSCYLPYEFMLGQTATGQSLVKEICKKGTSDHYLGMLAFLQTLSD